MRVAVVGTHGSGKTTLVEDFLARMPGYGHEAEPFLEMADLGTAFGLELSMLPDDDATPPQTPPPGHVAPHWTRPPQPSAM